MNAQLRRAIAVHRQWLDTARKTGDIRHFRTAAVCQEIATELLERIHAEAARRAELTQRRAPRHATARAGDD